MGEVRQSLTNTFTQMGTAGQRAFSEPGIGESLAGKRAIEARIWPRVQITPE